MAAATEYATIIRELFAPAAPATTDRAAAGVIDSARLSLKAAEGVTASEQLNIELEANLSSTDPGERVQAATQLLAKALTDLEVSAFLKTVADEEDAPMRSPAIAADRSARVPDVEEYLGIILRTKPGLPLAERATRILPDIPTARQKLSEAAEDSVALIVERALELAKTSFGKLASLGFAEVFKAAGVVGSGIADALGVSGKLSALYRLGRDFILKAYNALTSLLGDALAKIAGEKITGWIKEHTSTEHLAGWLKTQYAVDQTSAELKREISTSSDIGKMQSALERVETLSTQFGRQIDLERKLIKAMDYVRMIPGVTTSNGITLLAAGYILICGYSVFAAADYVDAAALQLLNRIAGIPTVIRQNL